jgi:predicted phosphoribosyltransferase
MVLAERPRKSPRWRRAVITGIAELFAATLCRSAKLHDRKAHMIFINRTGAGRSLAGLLEKYADRSDVLVLAIPRGGVPVAYTVAQALHAPLDVLLLRKLGVPGQEELAFGAIASGGVRVLDRDTVWELSISPSQVETVTARERLELERRELAYRGSSPPLSAEGKTVILVDDGIATGSSALAAIRALRQLRPAKIVVAVPVAPPAVCERLAAEADEFVCVLAPDHFVAVGQFYADFSQISDEEVIDMLSRNRVERLGTAA